MKHDFFFREHELPSNQNWSTLDEVPEELQRMMSIYRQSLDEAGDNDSVYERPFSDIDEFYEVYDLFEGQRCFVAGIDDEDQEVMLVANYALRRDGPFGEGIGVARSARGLGLARHAISEIVTIAREDGGAELRLRAQPRVAQYYEVILGARYIDHAPNPLMGIAAAE